MTLVLGAAPPLQYSYSSSESESCNRPRYNIRILALKVKLVRVNVCDVLELNVQFELSVQLNAFSDLDINSSKI